MDRTVLLVDAGHLLSGGGSLTVGEPKRSALDVDVCRLLTALISMVQEDSDLPLLRTYWYDGAREGRPMPEHVALQEMDYVKLRLGRLLQGKQKGVDALIYRDLTTLSRQRSIASAYVVAGDDDLREGVSDAQSLGIQVCLMAVEPSGASAVSQALIHEADRVIDLGRELLGPFFHLRGVDATNVTRSDAEPTD